MTLGAPGRIMPPAAKAIEFAQRAEADGFDAIWWPCHLMGWTPDSVWTEELHRARQATSRTRTTYFDPLMMMGAAGAATGRIKVGVCVTDTIRRHPAMLAQEALTVDHLAGGRAILGLGSGERMNVAPYGMEWHKPVGRLEEAIQVHAAAVEHRQAGRLRRRVLPSCRTPCSGSRAVRGPPPPIWLAAHGPRMLRITGRLADGWLPTNIRPDAYAEKLGAIRESAEQAGPRPRRDHAVDARLRDLRARRGDARAHVRVAAGARCCSPPSTCRRRPTRATARRRRSRAAPASTRSCPTTRRRATRPSGSSRTSRAGSCASTPCAARRSRSPTQIRDYQQAGLRDVVLWNITPFADPAQSVYSFRALRELRALLSATVA